MNNKTIIALEQPLSPNAILADTSDYSKDAVTEEAKKNVIIKIINNLLMKNYKEGEIFIRIYEDEIRKKVKEEFPDEYSTGYLTSFQRQFEIAGWEIKNHWRGYRDIDYYDFYRKK